MSTFNVHELWFDGSSWRMTDLTAATGGPPALSMLQAYIWNQSQHVIYCGGDYHIHELWFDVKAWKWNHSDLTQNSGAPLASGSAPFGYADAGGASQTERIVFQGQDLHIHELRLDIVLWQWKHTNLTAGLGMSPPSRSSGPMAYACNFDKTNHVIYEDGYPLNLPGDVNELWFDGSSWHHNDLTSLVPASKGQFVCGHAREKAMTQHIFYTNGSLHELWSDGNWHHNNLSAQLGQPASFIPFSYVEEVGNVETQYVLCQDAGHVHQFSYTSSWAHQDLTALANGPAQSYNPCAFRHVKTGTRHVVFNSGNGKIIDLWFDTSWHMNDVSAATNAPPSQGDVSAYYWDLDQTGHIVFRG